MHSAENDAPDTGLEQAHALLVAAINAQAPGTEARYLARLAMLLLNELQFSQRALSLIETAREAPRAQER